MPEINRKQILGERVNGYELKEKEVDGHPVVPAAIYKRKSVIEVPLNHNRHLKNAYKKAGMEGASAYANAVMNYVKSHSNEQLSK
jgi:hypothetical protein